MNESPWYKLLLGVFFACFACLLVTGADRLIGDGGSAPLMRKTPAAAYLCAVQAQGEQGELHAGKDGEPQRGRMDTASEGGSPSVGIAMQVGCDSNGNVLAGCSYMRAVYQVFALGDGFA